MEKFLRILKSKYFWVLAIVLLGFVLRLYKIDNPVADWHSWRQADTASVTRIYAEEGIDILHPRYHDISYLQSGKFNPQGWRFVEFPIYNTIHALLVKTFPQFSLEFWGRLLSVFASSFSTVIIFFLSRRFLGTAGGLLSSFFFALLPFNIYFSRVILPEPLAVTFALGGLLVFVYWYDTSAGSTGSLQAGSVQASRIYLFASGFFFAIAMLIKPYTIFYALPMLWLAGRKFNWQWREILRSRDLWTFALISLAPVFAWRVWMMQYPEGIPFYKWVFNSDGIRFKPSFWRWIFGERLGQLILGGWGIFVFVAGILAKSKPREVGFPLALGFGMFAYVSVIASANVRHDYYQTLVIPAIALVLARGTLYLWKAPFAQPATKLVLLVLIAWGFLFAAYDIRELYKVNHPEIITAGQAIDGLAPKDALVVAPYNGDTAFLYHTKRNGWPYQTNSIEELVSLGADYYVSVNLNDPQTQDVMRKFEIPEQTEEYVIVDLSKKRKPNE